MQLIGEYDTILNTSFSFKVPEYLVKQFVNLNYHKFYINKGFERCLIMYSEESWLTTCYNLFFKLNHNKPVIRDFLKYFFDSSVHTILDNNDKLSINKELTEFIGNPQNVILFAMNDRVEIWSKDDYYKMMGDELADFSNLASEVIGSFEVDNLNDDIAKKMSKAEEVNFANFTEFDSNLLSDELENVIFEKNISFDKYSKNTNLKYKDIFIPNSFFNLYRNQAFDTLNKIMMHKPVKVRHSNKIFLCHSSKDKDFVKSLALKLRQNNVDVWLDEWEMLPGDSLITKIQNGIDESSWFGVILSPHSVASKWCTKELNTAISKELEKNNVFVIPILKEVCDFPIFLKEKMYADLTKSNYEKGFNLLLKRLKN